LAKDILTPRIDLAILNQSKGMVFTTNHLNDNLSFKKAYFLRDLQIFEIIMAQLTINP
jgi:hypothetical protein